MKKSIYTLHTVLSLVLTSFVINADTTTQATGSEPARRPYPAITACVGKKSGDSCVLSPSNSRVSAMVVMSGTCQVAPVDIQGVKASALRCQPKSMALSSQQADAGADSTTGTTADTTAQTDSYILPS